MAATVISTGGVSAAVSYIKPEYEASHINISVEAKLTFPDRFLVEVFTPSDAIAKSFGKSVGDSYSLQDASSRNLNKSARDTVVMEDDTDIEFFLGKILADVASLSDAKVIALAKALVDLAVASDARSITLSKALTDSGLTLEDLASVTSNKGIHDSVTMLDTVEAVRLFAREFIETLVISDVAGLHVTKPPFNHSVATSDADTISFAKPVSESVVMIDNMDGDITYQVVKVIGELISSPTDQMVRSAGLAKSESVSTSSSGVAFMTDYADISYFAEDYVGVSSTFS